MRSLTTILEHIVRVRAYTFRMTDSNFSSNVRAYTFMNNKLIGVLGAPLMQLLGEAFLEYTQNETSISKQYAEQLAGNLMKDLSFEQLDSIRIRRASKYVTVAEHAVIPLMYAADRELPHDEKRNYRKKFVFVRWPMPEDRPKEKQVFILARNGQWEEVFQMIREGKASPNERCLGGMPLICGAAMDGNKQVVEKLLEFGATTHKLGASGEAALEVAKRFGHTQIVNMIQKNAKTNIQ